MKHRIERTQKKKGGKSGSVWFTAKATRIYMVQPQTTRIYMVTQINVPYLFAATRICMVLPQTTRIYMVTQINVPYLFEATRYCMVLPQTTRIYMVTQINVPYLCGDHNDTLYLWGHHLVSDRICRALSKYAMLLYGAHRHAPNLSGSTRVVS